jgi:hypothetical protein
MAHENKVLQSIETADSARCVDIFTRPDGSFGFEEYRREIEDARGWYRIGVFSGRRYTSEKEALDGALTHIPWLKERVKSA